MAFRDETEALRARVRALEKEGSEARERIAELEKELTDQPALEAEVRSLRAELERLRPAPAVERPKPRTPASGPARSPLRKLVLGGFAAGIATWGAVALWSAGAPQAEAAPTLGMLDLDRFPNPPPAQGTARGEHAATSFHESCRGYVADAPHLVLRAARPQAVRLETEAGADLVMVLRLADGTVRCDDDTGEGSQPAIRTVLPPGDHRVWIGTYGEAQEAAFRLTVQAATADAIPDPTGVASEARGTLGNLETDGAELQESFDGTATGWVTASAIDASCRGSVPIAPQLTLRLREPMAVRLTTESAADLVMMVRNAAGQTLCDDDGAGNVQPLVAGVFAAGVHRVWVGPFGDGQAIPFRLLVQARGLDDHPDASGVAVHGAPTMGTLHAAHTATGRFEGSVEGWSAMVHMVDGCGGFAAIRPQILLHTAVRRDVSLRATAQVPLTLLIHHPDGHFECGAGGAVRGTWPPGEHRVWIGTEHVGASADVAIDVETSEPSLAPW